METTTLKALAARYDWFFVDQFGVLRGADALYEGAREALAFLREAGRRVVILSNSGREGAYNAERLARLGIPPDLYDAFVTSGDAATALLTGDDPPVAVVPGMGCLVVTSGGITELPSRLGLRLVEQAEEADLVLIAGSEAERIPLSAYEAMLRPAAERGVTALCTNPDLQKLTAGGLVPAAGAIAAAYEALGGPVIHIGKPYRAIYDHAYARAGAPDRQRIVCVGDSLHHDIKGAAGFGLEAVLVGTGVAAGLDDAALAAAMAEAGCRPRWWMKRGFRPA